MSPFYGQPPSADGIIHLPTSQPGRGQGPLGLLELGQQKERTFKAGLKHVEP